MQHAIPREHDLALLRLESEQQLSLAEEIVKNGLPMKETRDKVRESLCKDMI